MATCRFVKPGAFNAFLQRLLDHEWIQVVAVFFARGSVLQLFLHRRAGRDDSGMDG